MCTTFSILLPVYNTDKYLEKCLDSVLNQTFSDFELICINDASTDNSPKILEEYAKKDDRVIVINNEKNRGLGASRNIGLAQAQGEYLALVDSDDWVEPFWLEKVYEGFKKANTNSVYLNAYEYTEKKTIKDDLVNSGTGFMTITPPKY